MLKLKSLLALALLALSYLPTGAHAAFDDIDRCPTPPPFWWRFDGPPRDLIAEDWRIEPVGEHFVVRFSLVNAGATTLEGGMSYTLSHAAVDALGHSNPASQRAPESARSLLGTELLTHSTLPTLRPGQRVEVSAYARGFHTNANHILTLSFYDGAQVQVPDAPWYWVRVHSPSLAPESLRLARAAVNPEPTPWVGYKASRVELLVQNTGRAPLEAGTPIAVGHSNGASAVGYWDPENPWGPNHPGNPVATVFRELLYQGRLDRELAPGEYLHLEVVLLAPEGIDSIKQVTVSVGP